MQAVQVAQADGVPVTAHATNPGTPTKSGFNFEGWFAPDASAAWNFTADAVTSDVLLTASWQEVLHPVTYYLNDGVATDPYHVDDAVRWDSKLTEPAPPARGGYAFGGWWTSSDGGATLNAQWDFANGTMPDANMDLYAKWTPVFEASVPVSLKGSVSAADGSVALPSKTSYRIVSKTPVPLSVASVEFSYAAAESADPLIASGRSKVAFSVNDMEVAGAKEGTPVAPGDTARFAVPAAVWSGAACTEGALDLELAMALNGATVSANPASSPFATLSFTLSMDESGR